MTTVSAINPPPGAKDMSRLHPVVRVDVPGTNNDPLLVSVHLKSGTLLADRFQRAVEMKRLTGWLSDAGLTDADNFIVLSDFNPSSNNAAFTELSASGLPGSFVLGSDITFPVTYSTDPLAYFTTPAAVRLDPRLSSRLSVLVPLAERRSAFTRRLFGWRHFYRNGFPARSSPRVVAGPWPGRMTV